MNEIEYDVRSRNPICVRRLERVEQRYAQRSYNAGQLHNADCVASAASDLASVQRAQDSIRARWLHVRQHVGHARTQ